MSLDLNDTNMVDLSAIKNEMLIHKISVKDIIETNVVIRDWIYVMNL